MDEKHYYYRLTFCIRKVFRTKKSNKCILLDVIIWQIFSMKVVQKHKKAQTLGKFCTIKIKSMYTNDYIGCDC